METSSDRHSRSAQPVLARDHTHVQQGPPRLQPPFRLLQLAAIAPLLSRGQRAPSSSIRAGKMGIRSRQTRSPQLSQALDRFCGPRLGSSQPVHLLLVLQGPNWTQGCRGGLSSAARSGGVSALGLQAQLLSTQPRRLWLGLRTDARWVANTGRRWQIPDPGAPPAGHDTRESEISSRKGPGRSPGLTPYSGEETALGLGNPSQIS